RASVGMPLSFMNLYRISRGMRRKREPGTRNPLSWPESKQRMIVCWLTLQILAASPVVNTVFMVLLPSLSACYHKPKHTLSVPEESMSVHLSEQEIAKFATSAGDADFTGLSKQARLYPSCGFGQWGFESPRVRQVD